MSTNEEQMDHEKLMHGRWFHLEDDKSLRVDTRPSETSLASYGQLAHLTPQEKENLLSKALFYVSGQASLVPQERGTLATEKERLRQQNIDVFYKYIEYENARDYENMEKLFPAEGFYSKTYFGNDPISPQAHTRMLKGLFRSFPDWFMVINEIIVADDTAVVGLITGRGTQYEEYKGRPPMDHQIAIPTLHAIKVRDGLIVEHRHINPFEDVFANQIMAPLSEDIMAIRAQQGFDSSMAQRAYDAALAAGASPEKLVELKALIDTKKRQCQAMLKGTLRRCAMIAPVGELYCEHHQHHGFGIDGLE